MEQRVDIYDTTLRDGMQGLEINFTLDDKLAIAHALDDAGFDYIEGGFPLSNEKEAEFFKRCRNEHFKHAHIVAFGSTRGPGHAANEDSHIRALVEAETPAVIVVGKTWKAHVDKVLRCSYQENLEMIRDSVAFLRSEGRTVFFDCEHFFDGFRHDPDYALQVVQAAEAGGADCVIPCDTNGGTLPSDIANAYDYIRAHTNVTLGGHFHNDCGTAVANSITAVEHGATQIQGTINGWGERCGNANLCAFVPNLVLKMDGYGCNAGERLAHITPLSRFVAEKANVIPDKRQPYVGIAAFSHKAGQHADVLAKESSLMEHIDGSLVGNERRVLLSELAGRSTIVDKLKPYGDFSKKSPEVEQLVETLKARERLGYEYEAAEASFDLLMRRVIGQYSPLVVLRNYHLETYKTADVESKTVGRMFLSSENKEIMGAATAVGPVETLDDALRDALGPHHPWLEHVHLVDYRVRVLNPEEDTSAKVRVFISTSDRNHTWDTVGVHENIVEASWEALVDSLEYYYNTFVLTHETEKAEAGVAGSSIAAHA